MQRHTGWHVLHQAFLAAGVTGMPGNHCIRKTFADNVRVVLGGDIYRLSKAMRHTSLFTTPAYLTYRHEDRPGHSSCVRVLCLKLRNSHQRRSEV